MQKNIRISIIGAVLVAVSLFGFFWVQQYLQRSRASAAPPTTSFTIAGPKVNPGDPFDLILHINPNLTPFYTFDIAFTYDPAKVTLQVTDPETILSNITPLSTKGDGVVDVELLNVAGSTSINTSTHTVRISGMRINAQGEPFTGREALPMVKVSFFMNQDQTLPLEFKWVDPDPAKISPSDSFQKVDLNYTEASAPTPEPTTDPANPPGDAAGHVPEVPYNSLTPIPTIRIGSSGREGETTFVRERGDLLYINSLASYPSPFRYEQNIKLQKGTYALLVAAKIYIRRERGVVVAVLCNETTCGTKKKDEAMYVSPVFPVKSDFSELSESFTIPDDADNKQYIFRIFCEDGSECEFDYISLEDAWGSQILRNNHFAASQQYSDPRQVPAGWVGDATADFYSSVDPNYGYKGALMINNSAK